jgi:Dolichyl-phosphate-mannose-protein mannosyltransferase
MNNNPQRNPTGLANFLDSAFIFFEAKKKIMLAASTCLQGAVGIYLFLWATATYGIGIRTDSVAYLWSARDLARGIGLGTLDAFGKFKPLVHFPPLYPAMLAPFEAFKIDSMIGARWLGALFIGLLVVLFAVILYRLTNRSFWFPTLGVLVLLFMPALWDTGLNAMTEPLYLICSLMGIICLDNYSTTTKHRWLLLASVLFSLSFLTRYIGISVITAGLLFLLLQKKPGFRHKLEDILVLGGIGVVPMAAWLLRNELLAGSATNRNIQYVTITAQEWQSTINSLTTFVEPARAAVKVDLLHLVILVIALGMAFAIFRRKASFSERIVTYLPGLLALYAGMYLLLTVGSRLLVDPTIPLYEDRILYPFCISVLFLVLYGLHLLLEYLRGRYRLLAVFMAGFLVIVSWGYIRINTSTKFPYVYVLPILQSRTNGLGLQFTPSLMEPFKNAITQLPEGTLFFTDDVEKLYFYTGKTSSYIGDLTPADIETLQAQLSTKGAVAVVFMDGEQEKQQALIDQLPQFHLVFTDDSGRAVYLGTMIP